MPDKERCHCGKLLHYTDPLVESMIRDYVRYFGSDVIVQVGGKRWLVPRHYIALHGLRAVDVPTLGFPEVSEEGTHD